MEHWIRVTLRMFSLGIEPATSEVKSETITLCECALILQPCRARRTNQFSCVLGYQAAYCQLAFAGSTDHDPFSATIPDAKIYLAQCLNKLSSAHPGKVMFQTAIISILFLFIKTHSGEQVFLDEFLNEFTCSCVPRASFFLRSNFR